MTLRLRPRSMWEGSDLGIRLLQNNLAATYACYLAAAFPVFAIAASTYRLAAWLPTLLIWLAKPWLDRTILYALSRALFNQSTTPREVWTARSDVWWSQLLPTFTTRRLSASRAFTQPIMQLEGLHGPELRARVKQLAQRHRGIARGVTVAFANAELSLYAALWSLDAWLSPQVSGLNPLALMSGSMPTQSVTMVLAYAAVVGFLEPFYVAAGFGMYLNRRVELEAWDIEQEFRRVFAL